MRHCETLKDKHQAEVEKIKKEFSDPNKYPNLAEVYGKMDSKWVQDKLATLYFDSTHNPLDDGFVPMTSNGKWDKSVYSALRRSLKRWDKSLSKAMNGFEYLARTPSGIYSKNPITIKFSNKTTNILNAERRNRAHYLDNLSKITQNLQSIFSAVNTKGSYFKTSKRLQNAYDRLAKYSSNKASNHDNIANTIKEINDILGSEETGDVLTAFTDMIENYNYADLDKVMKSDFSNEKYDVELMRNLVGTVREAKDFLNEMGSVNLHALNKTKDVVNKLFYKSNNPQAKRIIKSVDDAIERIKAGMEEGKYFPHYAVDAMINIEDIMDNADPFKIAVDTDYQSKVINEISSAISQLPTNVLSASKEKSSLFMKDPIKVLESYAHNSVIYNRKQFLMDAYLEAIQDLKPGETDFDGLSQMTEYLAHKFLATTKGTVNANDFIVSTSRNISKLQTISKMGLSLSGALRNSTQHFWYTTYVGFRNYRKAKNILKSNNTYFYNYVDENNKPVRRSIKEIMNSVSEEAGYYFADVSAETLSKGALSDLKGLNKKSIKTGVDKNGEPYVEFEQDGILRKLDRKAGEAAGFSLKFHQITENIVRGDVYKSAFAMSFDKFFNDETYKQSLKEQFMKENSALTNDGANKKVMNRLERQSHNLALKWVRMTQFEYDTADRPILFGGGTTNASAIGNSIFQFFPYAAHMFEMNSNVYREGLSSAMNLEFNNSKFGAMARMFGFQTFGIGLASIILNNEFRYLIENDTWNRLKNVFDIMTSDDIPNENFGNGIVQQFSGPIVGDMLFWMEAAGFTDFEDQELAQMLLGYHDYADLPKTEQDRKLWNRVSVSLNKVLRSSQPAIDGDIEAVLRNNFLLYPSKFSRNGHQQLMDILGLETTYRKNQEEKNRQISQTLADIPDDKKKNILSIIRELNKSTETDTGIPTGLQDLTIR